MPIADWLPAAVQAQARERKLKAGETLFRLGDKSAGLVEVVGGRVRLVRVDSAGHEIVLFVAEPGDTIAEASLFSPRYQCDAIAYTEAVVRIYPKPALLAAFAEDPNAAQGFTAMLARQVMTLRTRLEQRNIRSARERVRHFLALNVGPDGRTVDLGGASLKETAAELGLTHEAFYRTLAALERDGEIERGGANNAVITLSRAPTAI
jgi:CRP-like cAMP-binding protein